MDVKRKRRGVAMALINKVDEPANDPGVPQRVRDPVLDRLSDVREARERPSDPLGGGDDPPIALTHSFNEAGIALGQVRNRHLSVGVRRRA